MGDDGLHALQEIADPIRLDGMTKAVVVLTALVAAINDINATIAEQWQATSAYDFMVTKILSSLGSVVLHKSIKS